jgi:ribulose-5-phosphate 4-epimerase/fuculose-1-phosphate aldolase
MTSAQNLSSTFLRNEICRVGRSLFERGYVHGSTGNISVRLSAEQGGGFLITPTDVCLGFLDPDRLAKIDIHGHQISGDKASKTMPLHAAIYQKAVRFDADTSCIIHTHSTHCVALTLESNLASGDGTYSELLPAITPYFVMKVGHVPLVPYHRPGDPAVAEIVSELITTAIAKPLRAVMIERLGPNVWHQSLASAMATLEELEETAKLWLLSNRSVPALSDEQINELIARFNLRY